MKRWDWVRALKERSLLWSLMIVVPMAIAILGFTACVKYPVGDSEKSAVDPSFVGIWMTQEGDGDGSLMLMRPYDKRTYFVSIFSYDRDGESIKPTVQMDCKAWLTELGGATFVTMEPLSAAHFCGVGEQPPYLVGKLSLIEEQLHLQFVNSASEPARPAGNSAQLEKVLADHAASKELYHEDPLVFDAVDNRSRIEAVLKAFRLEGCQQW